MNDINIIGLTEKQAEEKRTEYGSNCINFKKENRFITLLLESLGDPIIKILLIALGIKIFFMMKDFDWYETIGILIAIFVASFISSISEYGSEKAFSKLQEETSKAKCKVKRDKNVKELAIDDVVVGDSILLESGDKIPADGYVISGEVAVDESSLNGETKEVYKKANSSDNRVFRGTVVYNGNAYIKITEVGINTMYGRLSKELQENQPDSPLKLRLRSLANIISRIGYVASVLVAVSYLFSAIFINNNFDIELIKATISNTPLMFSHILYALTLCVTIIVVAVPEGLPMMITLVLSSNMRRMLKDNVLVRKLVGIETSGSLNILFTDKTGTLTKGQLEVIKIMNGSFEEYKNESDIKRHSHLYHIMKHSIIANNDSKYSLTDNKVFGGNITDRALLKFMDTRTIDINPIKKVPFNSKNKYSAVSIKLDNKKINLVKGAPEKLIPMCKYYYANDGSKKVITNKEKLMNKISEATKDGIRVIVMTTSETENPETLISLSLVGIVFIKDEVRPEAIEGIKLVKNAHIKTVMVTGDNKDTAYAIGKELGLIESQNDIVITSDELNAMSDEKVMSIIPNLKIVARSLPTDKSRLVKICQAMNLVVGMTGDGVNDAPALKKADVGFAMGSGTEVSKEASDIVILDDNFMSISKAILFGRTVFKNIRKFIIVQLTINLCAITLSIIGPFIGIQTPVTVIQMLWVNMVMDTLSGLAFAYEPPLLEYMNEHPKKKDESLINKYMFSEILFTGFYSAIICILFLKVPYIGNLYRDNIYLMTAFFGLFIFIDIFNALNARTSRINIFANILKNKVFIVIMIFITLTQILLIYYGGSVFRTFGLNTKEFMVMILLAITVIPIDWLRKIILKKKGVSVSV